MSKALGKVAMVVGAVGLIATGVGAIAGAGILGAGLAAAAGTIATIGTIASVAAGVISVAAQLTAKKPTAYATGSQTRFAADPDAGIPLVLGRTGTAGNIIARFGFDTADKGENDRQSFVAGLSLGPVAAIEGMTVDRVTTSFNGTGAAIGAYAAFMWSLTQLGALPEPSALGFGAGAGTPPGWTSAHKLSGIAAASWTLRFDLDAKKYTNGVPAPMWTVKGALAYDPRKDSTYPGGSGSHRMADPADRAAYDAAQATWAWTENPFLLGLRWAHGFWQRDMTDGASVWQRVMGMGAPATAIDTAAFVEGANIADANSWTCGGVIFSGDDKWASMKKILQAGMGEPLALGARVSCLVNAPKVSLATITWADIKGEASVAATQPRRDRVNTITPRFRLEANNWELLPGSPITVADYVTADRGKRSKTLDYPMIQQTTQVATAVRYDIENAREFGPVVLPLGLAWMGYKPGDCVTATVPELGLNSQPLLLLNRNLDPMTGLVTLSGRSETNGKHAFALGQTTTPPPTPGVTAPLPSVLLAAIDAAGSTAAWSNILDDDGHKPEGNADVTATAQLNIEGQTTVRVSANSAGTPLADTTIGFSLTKGGAVVTADSWSIDSSTGVTVTNSGAVVTRSGAMAANAKFRVKATLGVGTVYKDVTLIRDDALPTSSSGGGGGGNPGTSGSGNVASTTTSNSYTTAGGESAFTCVAGSAGQVTLSINLYYSISKTTGVPVSENGNGKIQWRAVGGNLGGHFWRQRNYGQHRDVVIGGGIVGSDHRDRAGRQDWTDRRHDLRVSLPVRPRRLGGRRHRNWVGNTDRGRLVTWRAVTTKATGEVQFVNDEATYPASRFTVVALDHEPGPDDMFDGAGLVPNVSGITARVLSAVKARRDQAEWAGCATALGRVDTDPDSQRKVGGAVQMAMIAQSVGAPFAIGWTMADNSTVEHDASAMIGMGVAVGQHVAACHAVALGKRAAIAAAASVTDVEAVDLEEGWPDA